MSDSPSNGPGHTRAQLGRLEGAVTQRLAALDRDQTVFRLWAKDPTLWKDDPAHQAVARNRLGWLTLVDTMQKRIPELEAFARQVREAGFRRALLLGMGGSSLCPEVLRRTFGVAEGAVDVQVLDSTDPESVRRAEAAGDLEKTLFLVCSKSGATIEVDSFFRHFWSKVPNGGNFAAITDPGTPLEKLARERKFRHLFTHPADVGGRFSALTWVGLVPAALLGINLAWFLRDAGWMVQACSADVAAKANPGVWLGTVLAEAVRAGRDKLTLVLAEEAAALGSWIEQLIAESTGKEGQGVLPVDGEPLAAPEVYGDDRLFLQVGFDPARGKTPADAQIAELAKAGHPVMQIDLKDRHDLAGEFFRWETATAIAGSILRIDPFDEPNVKESKDLTGEILGRFKKEGRMPVEEPLVEGEGLRLYADPALTAAARGRSIREVLAAHLARAGAGDFVAWLAYIPRSAETDRELAAMRRSVRDRRRLATTVGYGPRFLHSTGQYHKGGPNRGVFLQITCDDAGDFPVPDAGYTFGVLKQAQALGDLRALLGRDRRVVRVHLVGAPEPGLAKLRAAIEASP